ncbi:MAG: hypothetical protein CSA24_02625 [Deltaproteobacteria bacterium]|nr:MAG: hypothetical protein CSA24_02625 [Deltaproteobacteria bacterium]
MLAIGGVWGCGSSDDALGVTNVSPMGSVGGVVVDLATGQPLAGVTVKLIAGAKVFPAAEAAAIVTDANGRFLIEKVPAGQFIIEMTPPATHLGARFDANIDDAAGDFPRNNGTASLGPIALTPVVPDGQEFKIRVINADGSPAGNVKTTARANFGWAWINDGMPSARGFTAVEATSDSVGVVTFKGLPDFAKLAALDGTGGITDTVTVNILPVDTNNDGVYDFPGTRQTFNINTLGNAYVPSVVLAQNPGNLQIIASTVPALNGKTGNRVVNAASPFFVAFNLPLHQATARLYDEQGNGVADPIKVTIDGSLLSMGFSKLVAGQEYNLLLHVVAVVPGTFIEKTYTTPFFIEPEASAKVVADLKANSSNANKVTVSFSEPIGTGANVNLSVVYFNYDLNASGATGDKPGEFGSDTTPYQLINREKNPPGGIGKSGFTSQWELSLPNVSGNPVASGTTIKFIFSRNNAPVTRANGEIIPDITVTVP